MSKVRLIDTKWYPGAVTCFITAAVLTSLFNLTIAKIALTITTLGFLFTMWIEIDLKEDLNESK